MHNLRWLATVVLIGCAAAAAQPAPEPLAMEPPTIEKAHRIAEQVIGLAVAEACCTGWHQQIIARYRPFIMRSHEGRIMLAGQWLASGYCQTHGEGWRDALVGQFAHIRSRFEQHPDQRRFCKQTAIAAHEWSDGHPAAETGFSLQYENEVIRRLIVAGL